MKRLYWLLPLALLPWQAQAADLANGERIYRSCALCHGLFGQGTPSRLSPRLAGQDKDYLERATKDYRDGKRAAPTMVKTSGLDQMSDQDIADVSAYLAQLDVPGGALFDIQAIQGDAKDGVKEFKECKNCHGTDGMGKPDEKAPRLAGQHTPYLFQSMKMFQWRKRKHGQEEDDQLLFDDYKDDDLYNLTAHLATLDNEQVAAARKAADRKVALAERKAQSEERRAEARARHETRKGGGAAPPSSGLQITDITQTVAQMQIKDGLNPADAVQAMLSKAAELNLKLVGQQEVSKELEARGVKSPYLTILQFCDPDDAKTMIVHNPIFASYMPCRIAVVEDQAGKFWVMMLNLDMLIDSKLIPPEVTEVAIRVNQSMLDVMVAGATGEF
jgi:cytochrome c553/uncharacterized protein (DUF302 family)